MTDWEQSLRNLAEGREWTFPALTRTLTSLQQLQTILGNVSSDTGLSGTAGMNASDTLDGAKKALSSLIGYLQAGTLQAAISDANDTREMAKEKLANLGAGGLNPAQTAAIRSAAAGSSVVLGPITVIAGEGAIAAANWFFGNQRSDDAKSAVEQVSRALDDAREKITTPPSKFDGGDSIFSTQDEDTDGRGWSGLGGSDGAGRGARYGASFTQYPDHSDPSPRTTTDNGYGVFTPPPSSGGSQTPILMPNPDPASPFTPLRPDGPMTGVAPGGSPALPGNGTIGGGLGTGGGTGGLGGVSSGLVAGVGGAAALGGLGKLASAGGAGALGRLGGLGGGAGGAGSLAGGAGRAGGLGGGAGGSGSLAGGAGRVGGLGGLGGSTGGLTANAGSSAAIRGGGLLGSTGGGAASAAAGEAGAGRGATGMVGGGAGAPGGAGGTSDKRGRGLGGPLAPKLEDDEEIGPWSENTGAGSRE